jgi:hypothetical protein
MLCNMKDLNCRVRIKIYELCWLNDGWYDGEGKTYSQTFTAQAADFTDKLIAKIEPLLEGEEVYVYPIPDGPIEIEFETLEKNITISYSETDLHYLHVYNKKEGETDYDEYFSNDPEDVKYIIDRIAYTMNPYYREIL